MIKETVLGLLVPFVGTTLGAGCVFFLKDRLGERLRRALCGFAAGVMVAASVWSLLLPAIEQSAHMGTWSFLPALVGFWAGILFLFALDRISPRLLLKAAKREKEDAGKIFMTVLAVTLHNIPEGMAVGVIYAGLLGASPEITAGGAFALALGIAIQNFPEGAIISMPLHASGETRAKAFCAGMLSGAVEPIFGALTLVAAGLIRPLLPYLLAFAAGAMIDVVVEELIPEMQVERRFDGTLFFTIGFTLMMVLDVALG